MTDSVESIEEEAVAFAIELLQGGDAGDANPWDMPKVAVILDSVADEYDAARRERRGMEPELVRSAVQALLDAARFSPENEPDMFDPDAAGHDKAWDDPSGAPVPPPIFRYIRRKGRPENLASAMVVAFAVGAVVGRFGISRYRNDERSARRKPALRTSALDIVATAHSKLRRQPSSYNGVRGCLERDHLTRQAFAQGKQFGEALLT